MQDLTSLMEILKLEPASNQQCACDPDIELFLRDGGALHGVIGYVHSAHTCAQLFS